LYYLSNLAPVCHLLQQCDICSSNNLVSFQGSIFWKRPETGKEKRGKISEIMKERERKRKKGERKRKLEVKG
jgi:hypothetical protein